MVNGRLKRFQVLRIHFRPDITAHWKCFHAVANITQLEICYEEPLFGIGLN